MHFWLIFSKFRYNPVLWWPIPSIESKNSILQWAILSKCDLRKYQSFCLGLEILSFLDINHRLATGHIGGQPLPSRVVGHLYGNGSRLLSSLACSTCLQLWCIVVAKEGHWNICQHGRLWTTWDIEMIVDLQLEILCLLKQATGDFSATPPQAQDPTRLAWNQFATRNIVLHDLLKARNSKNCTALCCMLHWWRPISSGENIPSGARSTWGLELRQEGLSLASFACSNLLSSRHKHLFLSCTYTRQLMHSKQNAEPHTTYPAQTGKTAHEVLGIHELFAAWMGS